MRVRSPLARRGASRPRSSAGAVSLVGCHGPCSGRFEQSRHVLRERDARVEGVDALATGIGDARGMERVAAERADHGTPVQLIAGERVTDGGKVRADLVAQRLADRRLDERPRARALQDPIARLRGARLVAHDVARMDARVDPALVLRVVRERKLDRSLVGQPLPRAEEQVALVEAAAPAALP